jgi:hypothetical protein
MEPLAAKPSFIVRMWRFILRHKISVIVISVALIASGVGLFLLAQWGMSLQPIASKNPIKKELPPVPAPKYYSPLTGVQVADEPATKKQVRAVMIENSPDARPQSGIKDCDVVFEAIAEGGITRFLCLFQEGHPALIGPVRSVRPYYIDWLAAFDATVSHVGGSKNALDEVRNGTYKDIDQFFNSAYYWRATDRVAPHNVYTSSDKLDQLNQLKGYTSSTFTGFSRKDDEPMATPAATSIDIDISYALFNVHYDYDKPSNSYIRSEGGARHVDRELGQIQPKTVIVIKVPTQLGYEDGYREQMQTIGSGQATIFEDGNVIQGTWSKASKHEQILFVDSTGKPIGLNRGQTWISVIAPEKAMTWR